MDFQKKYGKILLPLITPYDENEEIDYGKYAELIEYVITKRPLRLPHRHRHHRRSFPADV